MPDYAPSSAQAEPPDWLRRLVASALGAEGRSWRKPDTGLSRAHRFLVELDDGRAVFVKGAATAETAAWLRNEREAIAAAPPGLAPAILAWRSSPEGMPVLVTEALDGRWPASHAGVDWREGDLQRVLGALSRLSATPGPATLPAAPRVRSSAWASLGGRLEALAASGLCTAAWLAQAAPAMAQAEAGLDRSGRFFVHGDMRSDNICLMPPGPCFVDWSNARRGAAMSDLADFLPTARLEGGPPPQAVLADGAWAAAQAGEYARRVLDDQDAPAWLRRVARRLAAIALDWAAGSLALPQREGPVWERL